MRAVAIALLLTACSNCDTPSAQLPTARCIDAPFDAVKVGIDTLDLVASGDADALWGRLHPDIKRQLNPGDFATTIAALTGVIRRDTKPTLDQGHVVEISGGRVDEPVECAGIRLRLGLANQRIAYLLFDLGGAPIARGATVTLHDVGEGWRLGAVETYETKYRGQDADWFEGRADAHNQGGDSLAEMATALVAHRLADRGVAVQTEARRAFAARIKEVRADLPRKFWLDNATYDIRALELVVTADALVPDLHYESHGSSTDQNHVRKETRALMKEIRVRHPRLKEDFAHLRFSAYGHPEYPPGHRTRPLRTP